MRVSSALPVVSTVVALFASFPSALAEGEVPTPDYAKPVPYEFDTGTLHNPTAHLAPVHSHIVQIPGVPSLRLIFAEVDVEEGSYLVVTSLTDGHQHVMGSGEVIKWSQTTAYYNGDAVQLDLFLGPGARGSYRIDHALVGIAGLTTEEICGVDDRVPTTDNRAVRLLNIFGTSACSGWLASADDCIFSAGFCFPGFATVAEVNVPLSNPDGSFNHPPPVDQFPVDPASLTFVSSGFSQNWALGRLLPNNVGQSAATLHGYFTLASSDAPVGTTIRTTGFGIDDGTANQTNQTVTGPLVSTTVAYFYDVDTETGGFGSVVCDDATGEAVAIQSTGGCSNGAAVGTPIVNNEPLQSAFHTLCAQGDPGPPTAELDSDVTTAVAGQTVFFSDQSAGVPTAWMWDLDGDGLTDSTLEAPSFLYDTPGTYDVTLTVSNSFGSDTRSELAYITVIPATPVNLPYSQAWTGGLPADGSWLFQSSTPNGAISAGSDGTPSPGSGGPGLLMATAFGGPFNTNEASLLFQLPSGSVTLRYQFKEFLDEPHPEDGVFLSNGTSEVQLASHQNGQSDWGLVEIDVAAAAQTAGFAVNEELRVVFRQRDNTPIPIDGVAIDDVELIGGDATFTASPSFLSASLGGTITFSIDAGQGSASDLYAIVGTASGTSPGFNTQGFTIPLNPDPWFFLTVTQPNTPPLSNTIGVLDAGGKGAGQLTLPAGAAGALVGLVFDHLYATLTPGATILTVSNTSSFTVIP